MKYAAWLRAKVEGVKTQLVAVAGIVTALAAYSQGKLDGWGLVVAILVALGVITTKAGLRRRENLQRQALDLVKLDLVRAGRAWTVTSAEAKALWKPKVRWSEERDPEAEEREPETEEKESETEER